jgi:putative endonuclease
MEYTQKGQNKILGRKGEAIAVKLLQDKGLTILETNWIYDRKELDIIALDGDLLVIVEVKSRTWERYEDPADSMTDGKIRNILEATEAYMFENNIDREVRFDLISIIYFKEHVQSEHIQSAFLPMVE